MSEVTTSHTYQKGSWILHMLRGVVGTENFWKGIKIYYQKYHDSNATTADFRRVMEEVSNKDLSDFFEQWLYKSGALKYKGNWRFDVAKKEVKIKLDQIQNDGSLFKMPIEIGIYYPGKNESQIERVQVDAKTNLFKIKVISEPEKIVLDPNSWVLMDADFSEQE
jgi:aminopeptidase N